jgi:glyoxylase-like metal-dependent hydrolase (beta-lactamase superfamily II)/rhodanese-related sulfurtransferase
MLVQQFFVKGLAHSSYLLGGTETCAIVDPRRDVEIYVQAARDKGMRITHILETHLHADFISGHRDLAERTGATIIAPKTANCVFDHLGVQEGDRFALEDLQIKILETPGHTPEHVSYVVSDTTRGSEPVAVFTGDTLFVGDVGRPDLFPGKAEALADQLFDSLHEKLLTLPDFCEVYPAHGAGSLCGRAMGAKRTSTIGYERAYNDALQISKRQAFIESLTTNMPGAPDHFSRCSEINRQGPTLLQSLPELVALHPKQFEQQAKQKNTLVVDMRRYDAYAGQHVPGSYSLDLDGNFATFAGWVLPQDQPILLVAQTADQAREGRMWLHRVGLDRVVGYLDGGMFAWAKAGLAASHVLQLSAAQLHAAMQETSGSLQLVDVRSPAEFEKSHIDGAINIAVPDLRERYSELDSDSKIAVLCSTGHRSSLGVSLLRQHGFRQIVNIAGGMTGYQAAGYSPECPVCRPPHGPGVPEKQSAETVHA